MRSCGRTGTLDGDTVRQNAKEMWKCEFGVRDRAGGGADRHYLQLGSTTLFSIDISLNITLIYLLSAFTHAHTHAHHVTVPLTPLLSRIQGGFQVYSILSRADHREGAAPLTPQATPYWRLLGLPL